MSPAPLANGWGSGRFKIKRGVPLNVRSALRMWDNKASNKRTLYNLRRLDEVSACRCIIFNIDIAADTRVDLLHVFWFLHVNELYLCTSQGIPTNNNTSCANMITCVHVVSIVEVMMDASSSNTHTHAPMLLRSAQRVCKCHQMQSKHQDNILGNIGQTIKLKHSNI